mmetsp:Transcript_36370/g.87764  ORF Transcript_36370/g.87764 Transcript_36370/m.87764 type:complete len:215 (-) Transcript_36370:313-957(-)
MRLEHLGNGDRQILLPGVHDFGGNSAGVDTGHHEADADECRGHGSDRVRSFLRHRAGLRPRPGNGGGLRWHIANGLCVQLRQPPGVQRLVVHLCRNELLHDGGEHHARRAIAGVHRQFGGPGRISPGQPYRHRCHRRVLHRVQPSLLRGVRRRNPHRADRIPRRDVGNDDSAGVLGGGLIDVPPAGLPRNGGGARLLLDAKSRHGQRHAKRRHR